MDKKFEHEKNIRVLDREILMDAMNSRPGYRKNMRLHAIDRKKQGKIISAYQSLIYETLSKGENFVIPEFAEISIVGKEVKEVQFRKHIAIHEGRLVPTRATSSNYRYNLHIEFHKDIAATCWGCRLIGSAALLKPIIDKVKTKELNFPIYQ